MTPGHLFEWARLCLHLLAAEAAVGSPPRDWLLDAAELYRTAVEIGWADRQEGFVYTTDFDGSPITRTRMHWVLTEAIGAAAALHQVTGEATYAEDHNAGGTSRRHTSSIWNAGPGMELGWTCAPRLGPGTASPTFTTRSRRLWCRACRCSMFAAALHRR